VKKDGRWVNPLGEKFIPGEPVSARRRGAFDRHLQTLLEHLEREAPLAADGARS
jgi:hypothetical protein